MTAHLRSDSRSTNLTRATASLAALLLALGFAGCATSRPAAPAPAPVASFAGLPLDAVAGIDSRIHTGRLENGLTYYVLPHRKPENRAQLWLVINAGSTLEDDDQQGLAHFVEHMAFNGTEKYPKQAIVDYIEQIGMDFGADLNAYTSFDETVYTLAVPTDDAKLVTTGLDILHEWAHAITFDATEIDKERGVVLEEWRLGRGAWERIFDKQSPVVFNQSRYAQRLPIGKPEILQSAQRDAFTRFYRDWYRPDLMAIIAVGDFDAETMQRRIRERFGGLRGPAELRPREEYGIPPHAETLYSATTDAEMPTTMVSIDTRMPHRRETTIGDYRRIVAERIFHQMMGARFDEIRQRPDAPILGAWSYTGGITRTVDNFGRGAQAKEGKAAETLALLLEETARVVQHGFTAGELDRAKKRALRGMQNAVSERDKTESAAFAEEILRHFLEGEQMPGLEAELSLYERFLPEITLTEMNAMASAWGGSSNRVVLMSGPDKTPLPAAESLPALVRTAEAKLLEPWSDGAPVGPLVKTPPASGSVVATRTDELLGLTEWTLSNGIRVVLKPTDFQNDEIILSGFSPGGSSLASDAEWADARFGSSIAAEGGVGELDRVALRKALAGRLASGSAWIGELEEGLSGRSSKDDFETMLQLVWLSATSPRRDENAFAAWKARTAEQVRNTRLDPESSFWEDMSAVLADNHPRRKPLRPEDLGEIDLDAALSFFRSRFADAGDFTFVIAGNVDLATAKPLVERWIGGLPSTGRRESWRDIGVRRPDGVKRVEVKKGREPKSAVYLTFSGPAAWSRESALDAQVLADVMSIRLREVLREDMGGVYGASIWGGLRRRPTEEYSFGVSFGCAPENVAALRKAVFDEIAKVQAEGIGDTWLAKVRENWKRQHEIAVRENGYWAGRLLEALRFGDDPRLILDLDGRLARITSANVKAAAIKYLDTSRYVEGVLNPE
ncbi:MAG: M16 family metallopeptidase [Thermoanaerobaculia bacterium]